MTIQRSADPLYLNFLYHSGPSNWLVVSLISGQGYFTFLYWHTKHIACSSETVEENRNFKHGLIPSAISLWYFPDIQWAFTSMSSSEIPAKPLRILIHPLTLANPASVSIGPNSSSLNSDCIACVLLSSANRPFLQTVLYCRLLSCCLLLNGRGPSIPSPFPVLWEISHAIALCGFHAIAKKGILLQPLLLF